jgi:guanylate kinase
MAFMRRLTKILTLATILEISMLNGSLAFQQSRLMIASRNVCRSALYVASLPRQSSTKYTTGSSKQIPIKPLVVCGPSGVGKGTIISRYMEDLGGSDRFQFTVSHTTRKPRPGEIDGVHYHFTDIESMKAAIERNEFLEWANVHGNYYGTSLDSLSTSKKYPLLDIDVQGVKSIKKWQEEKKDFSQPALDAKFVFIAPPSLDVLKDRLNFRGTETAESLEKRTKNAIAEVEYGMTKGNFDAIVVNDDLDRACHEFGRVIEDLYGKQQ